MLNLPVIKIHQTTAERVEQHPFWIEFLFLPSFMKFYELLENKYLQLRDIIVNSPVATAGLYKWDRTESSSVTPPALQCNQKWKFCFGKKNNLISLSDRPAIENTWNLSLLHPQKTVLWNFAMPKSLAVLNRNQFKTHINIDSAMIYVPRSEMTYSVTSCLVLKTKFENKGFSKDLGRLISYNDD